MARWDPGTEERLRTAALALCAEHGYDAVTVSQIADRAGITRRTFFRYFPDKREVLFAGSEQLPPAMAAAVRGADGSATPMTAALGAVAEVGAMLVDRVEHAPTRRAVIAASAELQERERTKLAAVAAAIRAALEERGVDPVRAGPTARIATIAFQEAFADWADAGGRHSFRDCLDGVVAMLREVITT